MVARYVFHRPLVWSDELASILFLWLAMLGAVVALRRSEHMRLTAAGQRAAPRRRGALSTRWRSRAGRAFLAADRCIRRSSTPIDEAIIVTPALEIANIWRAAALPVGWR